MSPKKSTEDRRLHRIVDAMAILRCSRRKVYYLAEQGRLDLVKLDYGSRITDESLRKLLDEIESRKGKAMS
jgi:hypothetical protein